MSVYACARLRCGPGRMGRPGSHPADACGACDPRCSLEHQGRLPGGGTAVMSLKRDEDACGACDPAALWGPRLHPCWLTAELLLCPQIRRGASEPARRQAAPSHQDAPTAAPSAHPAIRCQFAIVSEWGRGLPCFLGLWDASVCRQCGVLPRPQPLQLSLSLRGN